MYSLTYIYEITIHMLTTQPLSVSIRLTHIDQITHYKKWLTGSILCQNLLLKRLCGPFEYEHKLYGKDRKTNEFRGFNIIFIDEQVRQMRSYPSKFIILNHISNILLIPLLQRYRIHAFISDKIADGYAADLKEGQVYIVSNFKVFKYTKEQKNRCVRNYKHIYFDDHTEMTVLTDNSVHLKPYAFDLYCLKDVSNFLSDSNCFLIGNLAYVLTYNFRRSLLVIDYIFQTYK